MADGVWMAGRKRQVKRKKTGRWCKGRVGVEHDWVHDETRDLKWFDHETIQFWRCAKCRKEDWR